MKCLQLVGLTDIQTKWHVEFRIPVLSLLLLKADATKDLAKYYPLGAGVSSLVGTGDNSSKIIANEVVRTVWVSARHSHQYYFVYVHS